MKKIMSLTLALLMTVLLLAGCGADKATTPTLDNLEALGEMQATDFLEFTNGVYNITYDGNALLPVNYTSGGEGTLMEVNFVYADMESTDNYGYGFVSYRPTTVADNLDVEVENNELFFTGEKMEFTSKEPYGQQSETRVAYIYEWPNGAEATTYAYICCENYESGSRVDYFVSSMKDVIYKKATQISDSFTLIEDGLYSNEVVAESLERTQEIYAHYFPEIGEVLDEPVISGDEEALQAEQDMTQSPNYGKELFLDSTYTIFVGNYFTLPVTGSAASDTLHYMSMDTSIATVDEYGNVTGVSAGEVQVIASTEYGVTATTTVIVQ